MKPFKNIIILPKSIILIFLITAVIVISSAVIELNQSKREMLEIMENQSYSLLESLLASSTNALLSGEKYENELKDRLLNNASFIKTLYEKGEISNSLLSKISRSNNLFRINIFSAKAEKLFSSDPVELHPSNAENQDPSEILAPIFSGEEDTLILGIKKARYLNEYRYAVALSASGRGAVVVNVDAGKLIEFRKQVGFGSLLKDVTGNSNIEYAILQDSVNIIAAAGNGAHFNLIPPSELFARGNSANSYVIIDRDSLSLFEARHPFTYKNRTVGVFRLGLSMDPVNQISSRITRRIIIMSLFLTVFGSIAFAFVFIRQNYLQLSKKFTSFKEYSQNIIDNIGESIILLDPGFVVKSCNRATGDIFGVDPVKITGIHLSEAFKTCSLEPVINGNAAVTEIDCPVGDGVRTLLISKSGFLDETGIENIILVIKDLTEINELEKQFEIKERLAAMGELASTVAHEIRNPLNSISTIVQQLNKDFEPKENKEEYGVFTSLVYSEVNRINATIESFLRFARPVEMKAESFNIEDLINQMKNQYVSFASEKNISFSVSLNWTGTVVWDKNQILQALINIIENAFDATPSGGAVSINLNEKSRSLLNIIISDSGKGIDRSVLGRVFDLYYTTKQKGNGLGLSIVQKIITAHKGQIHLESTPGEGTKFTITLPKVI